MSEIKSTTQNKQPTLGVIIVNVNPEKGFSENNLFVFHRVEIWHHNISIPALVFLTPLQNNPLS